MADSQNHRPGVSVKRSPSAYIAKQLKRAADIEKQLESCQKSNEEKAGKLRRHLCEVLSDILLSDPVLARENDCCGRLWNACFYKVVSTLRSRISREKRKKGPNLQSLKTQFQKFLGEATTLYDYLVGQYHAKLVSDGSQNPSQESATQESGILSTDGQSASLDGVIPNLFRFYIHMGDLHRYAESYNKAESCYLNAAKLAPGKGNPYNQLAVVAQVKDANMSCLALYWYARSLLATHQSFETSSGNLDRLFNVNKSYLNEHSRDAQPPILSMDNKKKMSTELVRAQKAAASKSCLAHFVDVHFELFKNSDSVDADTESHLRTKMAGVMESLESLCRVSAFGDALLCKIVTINTFTFEVTKKDPTAVNHRLSREFLFVLGSSLATRLEASMSKILEKDRIAAPAIRMLLPYQILCEFIEHLDTKKGEQEDVFWKKFAVIANLALKIAKEMDVAANSFRLEGDLNVPLKEYQALRGFRPYSFLFETYTNSEPFIGPDDAIEALELTMSQSQESAGNTSREESKAKLSRFLAICGLYVDKESIPISQNDNGYAFVGEDDTRDDEMSVESKQEKTDTLDESMNIDTHSPQDNNFPVEIESPDEDEAGDVVVYKAPETGDGPPLLVPGAILASAAKQAEKSPDSSPTIRVEATTSSERTQIPRYDVLPTSADMKPDPPPPPGLLPPPGFGAYVREEKTSQPTPSIQQGIAYGQTNMGHPPSSAMQQGIAYGQTNMGRPPSSAMQQGMSYGQTKMGHPPSYPMAPNLPNYTSFQGYVPHHVGPPMPMRGPLPMDHTWQIMGGPQMLQTLNPFAHPPSVSYGEGKDSHSLFEEQPTTSEGTSLLDSALIDSLFLNDTETNNPWK
eukprot:scaffold5799_cov110-Cylindrotheca_fusiformis.AAC.3